MNRIRRGLSLDAGDPFNSVSPDAIADAYFAEDVLRQHPASFWRFPLSVDRRMWVFGRRKLFLQCYRLIGNRQSVKVINTIDICCTYYKQEQKVNFNINFRLLFLVEISLG